jgi:hypothetical protein
LSGLETSERYGDAFALADLKRLAGRVLLTQGFRDQARREFEAAVHIAQRQDAGLYLLRAARDLAQLFTDEGDAATARGILSPIVESIMEFRSGPDVREAAVLLSTLAPG